MRITTPIWKRTVKINGEDTTIFSGPLGIGNFDVTIWPVKERKTDKSPTHELVVQERREQRQHGDDDPNRGEF